MRDIDKLNALTNPLMHGEKITINDDVWIVGQTIAGQWYLTDDNAVHGMCCLSDCMVNFIYQIVAFNDGANVQMF